MKNVIVSLLFCLSLGSCNNRTLPPAESPYYKGYFIVLLRGNPYERHGDVTERTKHLLLRSVSDTTKIIDVSQHYYQFLTDSVYYVTRNGDILYLEDINKNDFLYSD
jgi:hypothetical protein